jgi:AraC-like DNA-binding protein
MGPSSTAAWEVVSPQRPSRVSGVTMAGFRIGSAAFRLVPHPAVTVALAFGAGRPVVEDSAGGTHRGSIVAGAGFGCTGAMWARGEDIACVQVRLSPVVARAVLGVSPAELDGAVLGLEQVWGRAAGRIGEQLGELTSWEERFALVDAVVARRRQARTAVDPEVAWAWGRIVATRGAVRVEHLADELGWSRKRLWSRFGAQLGLPPKRAGKLVRFDRAAHRLAAGENPARVAAESGYADQSHLHRDVVAFTGTTPTTVAAEPFLAVDDVAWPMRHEL